MQAKVTRHDHYWIVAYEGDTVGLMPDALPEVLSALADGAHEIILDLSGLRFLNPNGIEALRKSLEASRSREASLGIAAPRPQVRRALKLSGLTPDIPIYYSEFEAITKLDLVDYEETSKQECTDRLLICQKGLPIAGDLRKALRKHPLKPHFRMIPVRSLKRGFQVLMEERIDCILLDSSFPLFQVTKFIEQVVTDDRLPKTPIVVVSSESRLDETDLMIRNGADEVLRYPFNPIEVSIRLQTLISHLKDHRPYVPPEKVVQPRGWRA